MRAFTREAYQRIKPRSGGMEFALEMIINASKAGLRSTEIPIVYHPRLGESKLDSITDGWRSLRFMLLYSPSWLFFVPGGFLLLLGVAGMLVLASGPVDIFGRTWQIHTMLAFVALTLIGAQVIQLGLFARTYALVHFQEHDALLERARPKVRLEHGLLLGAGLILAGAAVAVTVFFRWANAGFGALADEYPTALAVTLFGLGVQTIFGSFFIGLLTMRSDRAATAPPATIVADDRMPTHA
jgi:uncharacterized membrane protein YidH (DUF202 family)